MEIVENKSLGKLNTFGLGVNSRYYTELTSREDFIEAATLHFHRYPEVLILGGGSNMLFTRDVEGITLAVRNKGIDMADYGRDEVLLTARAGENWHELVLFCAREGLSGIENLAMIPGNAGTAPVQNIGAYGVELKDVFHSLEAFVLGSGEQIVMSKDECRFAYRDSIFKGELKNRVLIAAITLKLSLKFTPDLSYRGLREHLDVAGISSPSLSQMVEAVCSLRASKLPDPAVTGNAGSFFKNPVVSIEKHVELQGRYPDLVSYPQEDGSFKLAAGWLIEQCGLKGKRLGDAAVHDRQALVLVNHGNASGREILRLATLVQSSVMEKFGVNLEFEVNVI
ncbi:MAG TPA: UDP-N-acetylmuramate dehydrogenase [Bacteroidales bacterium]|nr:UDP-N-acetylmuramate dehydrogenase [Bacteroidales bacterium]HSA43311.1 UDP-N-acetylmuramate dehydrogenase [Bacteroidales bacterium]